MIKKIVCSILLLLSFELLAQPQNKLVILNWADYLDPEIIAEFEAQHNARVTEIYYESDEHRTQMLVDQMVSGASGVGYDLILTSGIDISAYVRKKWLAPINFNLIPNSRHISPVWKNAFEKSEQYGVPFFWGTIGVVYRSDLIGIKDESWKTIYSPPEQLRGKVGMIADGRELTGMALKALGYSINSTSPTELQEVEQLVLNQKPFVRSYHYINLNEESEILSGEVWASMIYNGDALMVMEHSDDLKFFTPREGTNLWVDYFAVGANANNPELAHDFINFINSPPIAARMAEYTYYASPNTEAKKLLPEEFITNPVIYPPEEIISKSEFYKPLPARSIIKRKRISARILSTAYEASN